MVFTLTTGSATLSIFRPGFATFYDCPFSMLMQSDLSSDQLDSKYGSACSIQNFTDLIQLDGSHSNCSDV